MDIGARIAAIRRKKGMRQVDLARRAGCVQSMISRIERGHITPSLRLLERIAEALGVRMDELFAEQLDAVERHSA